MSARSLQPLSWFEPGFQPSFCRVIVGVAYAENTAVQCFASLAFQARLQAIHEVFVASSRWGAVV